MKKHTLDVTATTLDNHAGFQRYPGRVQCSWCTLAAPAPQARTQLARHESGPPPIAT